MSQTLPDLVVSPCPVRERLACLYFRSNVLMCCGRSDGFSLHPTWHGAVVVNRWRRYAQFEVNPAEGELEESDLCLMLSENAAPYRYPLESLRERIPQIPVEPTSGTFNAIIEDAIVPIDVQVMEDAVYFRLRDHLGRSFDTTRATAHLWAPDGMEWYAGVEDDWFIHFAAKQPPKSDWTLTKVFSRLRRSKQDRRSEEETTTI